jgi:ABC-type branched-subunit amino acid transport system ATPase component
MAVRSSEEERNVVREISGENSDEELCLLGEVENRVFKVEDISLSFGKIAALNRVSLNFNSSEIMALIGPNGAGKTSLLNVINGLYKPGGGAVYFEGRDISRMPPHLRVKFRTRPNIPGDPTIFEHDRA